MDCSFKIAGTGRRIGNLNRDDFKLSRSQRMQLKAFVCLLGVLLIILLLLGKLIGAFLHREEPEEPESSTTPQIGRAHV